MSVFLTPNLHPIAGGTYFPPEDKYGRRGFKSILLDVAKQVNSVLSSLFNLKKKNIVTTKIPLFVVEGRS